MSLSQMVREVGRKSPVLRQREVRRTSRVKEGEKSRIWSFHRLNLLFKTDLWNRIWKVLYCCIFGHLFISTGASVDFSQHVKFPFHGHMLKNWPLLYSGCDNVTKQISLFCFSLLWTYFVVNLFVVNLNREPTNHHRPYHSRHRRTWLYSNSSMDNLLLTIYFLIICFS